MKIMKTKLNMSMKTKRLVNAAVWTAAAIALTAGVCVEWQRQGCGVSSLVLGIAIFGMFCIGFGIAFDQTIQGK